MKKLSNNFVILCCLLILSLATNNAFSQIPIAGWYFNAYGGNLRATGDESSAKARIINDHLQVSDLTRGKGLIGHGFARSFSGKFMDITERTTTERDASKDGAYIEFKLSPKDAHKVELETLKFRLRFSANSGNHANPYHFKWYYCVGPSWNDKKKIDLSGNKNTIAGGDGTEYSVDLSQQAGLVNLGTFEVTFRLYVWGANGTAAGDRFFNLLSNNTEIEPSYALAIYGQVK